jgi:hypothetical protein
MFRAYQCVYVSVCFMFFVFEKRFDTPASLRPSDTGNPTCVAGRSPYPAAPPPLPLALPRWRRPRPPKVLLGGARGERMGAQLESRGGGSWCADMAAAAELLRSWRGTARRQGGGLSGAAGGGGGLAAVRPRSGPVWASAGRGFPPCVAPSWCYTLSSRPAVLRLCLLGVATPVDGCIPFGLPSSGVVSAKGASHFASGRTAHLLHLVYGEAAPVLVVTASSPAELVGRLVASVDSCWVWWISGSYAKQCFSVGVWSTG